jgi:hypothetical protein|tara:strand:+ start:119 stop:406 length:288 start_codon:yes stop_codon:yes gene_type:complete
MSKFKVQVTFGCVTIGEQKFHEAKELWNWLQDQAPTPKPLQISMPDLYPKEAREGITIQKYSASGKKQLTAADLAEINASLSASLSKMFAKEPTP